MQKEGEGEIESSCVLKGAMRRITGIKDQRRREAFETETKATKKRLKRECEE